MVHIKFTFVLAQMVAAFKIKPSKLKTNKTTLLPSRQQPPTPHAEQAHRQYSTTNRTDDDAVVGLCCGRVSEKAIVFRVYL